MIKDIEFELRREPTGIRTVCLITRSDGQVVESIPMSPCESTGKKEENRRLWQRLCQDWGEYPVRQLTGDEVFALRFLFFPEPHPVEEKLLEIRNRSLVD